MTRFVCSAFVLVLLGASPLLAQDSEKESDSEAVTKALQKIAELGPGVYKVKQDKKGRIQSCIVVGSSRISTVLGKSKGLQTAQQRAALDARGEFVKWIKDKVEIHESSSDETTLFLEGSEENDEKTQRESGKAIEKNDKNIGSASEGLIRGLELLHREVNGEDKTLFLVYGWNANTAVAVRQVGQDESSANDKGTRAAKPDKKKSGDKDIEDKSTTSDSAKKFLD